MTPMIESARRAYEHHATLVRNAAAHYLKRTMAARGLTPRRQEMLDLVDDAVYRSWAIWIEQRYATPMPNEGTLDERIAARDRRAAFRSARAAARSALRDAARSAARRKRDLAEWFYGEEYTQRNSSSEEPDGQEWVWHHVPERLRTTAMALAAGVSVEDCAAVQGVADRTVRNHKRELRVALGLANLERGLRLAC